MGFFFRFLAEQPNESLQTTWVRHQTMGRSHTVTSRPNTDDSDAAEHCPPPATQLPSQQPSATPDAHAVLTLYEAAEADDAVLGRTPSPMTFPETETQPYREPPPSRTEAENSRAAARALSMLQSKLDFPSSRARYSSPLPPTDDDIVAAGPKLTKHNAVTFIPSTLEDGLTILGMEKVTNAALASFATVLKVRKAAKLPKEMKAEIVVTKMVDLKCSLQSLYDVMEQPRGSISTLDEAARRVLHVQPSAVRTTTDRSGLRQLGWSHLPQRHTSRISTDTASAPTPSGLVMRSPTSLRQPDFESSEFARLLHALADPRMSTACERLMRPRSREELDSTPSDPWDEFISVLYNDVSFQPSSVRNLAGGVTRSDIAGIDPASRTHHRTASTLKSKFGQLKSSYGTCVTRFEASGQSDPDNFVAFAEGKAYIMYAFCFFREHPTLQSLGTRAIPRDAQREEGLPSDADSDVDAPRSARKRRRTSGREITIHGLDSLSSALGSSVQDAEVARATEKEELYKARAEAADAQGRAALTIMASITASEEKRDNAKCDKERALYTTVIGTMTAKLTDSL